MGLHPSGGKAIPSRSGLTLTLRRLALALASGLVLGIGLYSIAIRGRDAQAQAAIQSIMDPRLAELRKASVTWDVRRGPSRVVLDQVCLVPDEAAFFQAIAAWDDTTWFPILIEDVESTLRFLRAFRPARVIRFPGSAKPPADPQARWSDAALAVGRAWSPSNDDASPPRGDQPRPDRSLSAPGVVVSHPEAPMLAGAVALAAGRFQPLLWWTKPPGISDEPPADQAETLAIQLEEEVAARWPNYRGLGDDCDFLTIAGDYPYRYRAEKRIAAGEGTAAFDDLLGRDLAGRSGPDQRRWAYTGRLLGDPTQSVYRAMCSLFLQPSEATLFNGYSLKTDPWPEYAMTAAVGPLRRVIPRVTPVAAPDGADLHAWHVAFRPWNRAGWIQINSSGDPNAFNLPGRGGKTADIPMGAPCFVSMIHSFSAARPSDPSTLAGRWLANGAFAYFGSMNEPFLNAFRKPALIASLAADGLPFAAAVRAVPGEVAVRNGNELVDFARPWRLVVLGDPLYRLERPTARRPAAPGSTTAAWPAYSADPAPASAETFDQFRVAIAQSLVFAASGKAPPDSLTALLRSIGRDRLPRSLALARDALLVDTLITQEKPDEAAAYLASLPRGDQTDANLRWLETLQMSRLDRALGRNDGAGAIRVWEQCLATPALGPILGDVTQRMSPIMRNERNRATWRIALRRAIGSQRGAAIAGDLSKELSAVESAIGSGR